MKNEQVEKQIGDYLGFQVRVAKSAKGQRLLYTAEGWIGPVAIAAAASKEELTAILPQLRDEFAALRKAKPKPEAPAPPPIAQKAVMPLPPGWFFDGQTLTVDGVQIAPAALEHLVNSDGSRWMRMERKGDQLIVNACDTYKVDPDAPRWTPLEARLLRLLFAPEYRRDGLDTILALAAHATTNPAKPTP